MTVLDTIRELEEAKNSYINALADVRANPDNYTDKDVFILIRDFMDSRRALQKYDDVIPWLVDAYGQTVHDAVKQQLNKNFGKDTKRGTKELALQNYNHISWRVLFIDGSSYLLGNTNTTEFIYIEKL